ncbi:hypothetical protein ACFORH_43420 [Amycolatopsis roodepoortensis]|uniref:Uncharacterized protein n=1 Tax=Amycolatopsis roodepoortensis TaxID=700274 RepID=A0ABR9LJD8_9PSEU|nr:hypothetical protein [Amycolatopsis roodepoortensis]MBE1580407.1 hypothetical protein [Amycolatopsis roodepoortensis]
MSAGTGGAARPPRVEDLPKFRGLPVPYLVPWDGEAGYEPVIRVSLTDGVWRVAFADERPGDRDDRGVLWYRNEPRVDGEDLVALPHMGRVHERRQRDCMQRPACQVCSRSLDPDAVPWLLPTPEMADMGEGGHRCTPTPPTCLDCVPASRRYCPALREAGSTLLTVRAFTVWGVSGIVCSTPADAAELLGRRRKGWIGWDSELLPLTIAQEIVVRIDEFDIVDAAPVDDPALL